MAVAPNLPPFTHFPLEYFTMPQTTKKKSKKKEKKKARRKAKEDKAVTEDADDGGSADSGDNALVADEVPTATSGAETCATPLSPF